ncbi:MAG: GNAT family N-acetyltransferase [Acetobacter sp.]|nr:GNAT family N-acetyltransferase [Bacteroides sp.]MCM1341616.1 GNAT family N-acetyltransferase [Acetobacter sp.]MCM1434063.1 GNAT family N-acetyltransferase [Clostridiales bacterium]
MRCDCFHKIDYSSDNVDIRNYCQGDEILWAEIETAIGDFESTENALEYFNLHYKTDDIFERCFFAKCENKIVGTCIAWYDFKDNKKISSLHWMAVLPGYQGRGIGKKLLNSVMQFYNSNDLMPVYLHTQPWSYKAVGLYLSAGFEFQQSDTFANYKNEYNDAIEILKNYMIL